MAKRKTPEAALQKYTVQLLKLHRSMDVLYFSVPNEGKRSARTAAFLKALGMRPGVADMVLIVNGKAHFLELKSANGRQSPEQRDFQEECNALMIPYQIARTPEEVNRILLGWRAIPDVPGWVKARMAA